jgi:hypothetical protein
VDIDFAYEYFPECPTPANGHIDIYGSATNYNSLVDSIDVVVFWGDGTSDTQRVELYDATSIDHESGGAKRFAKHRPQTAQRWSIFGPPDARR